MMAMEKPHKTWVICSQCEDGFDGHDCGEDICCCLYPEENMKCDTCDGKGGWYIDEDFGDSITQWELSEIMMARDNAKRENNK